MSDGDALLSTIFAQPDEDVPRLAYADWLDEYGNASDRARAELIRVQIELAHIPLRDYVPWNRPLVELWGHQKQLLTKYQQAWLAPLQEEGEPLRDAHAEFRRGFVEVVWMPAGWFITRAERLFARVPVRELRVTRTTMKDFAALVHSPYFGRLTALDVADPRLGDEMANVLARRANSLRTLRLRGCGLTDIAAFYLADAEFDWPLRELDVQHNPLLGAAGLDVLRNRFGEGTVVVSG